MTLYDYPTGEAGQPGDGAAQRTEYLLPEASERDWAQLLSYTTPRHLVVGEALISPGALERSLYIVAAGSLEVLVLTRGRHWRRVRTVGPRSLLGEMAFFDAEPRSALVRALTPVDVAELEIGEFQLLAAESPELAMSLVMDLGRLLAHRVRTIEARNLAWGNS